MTTRVTVTTIDGGKHTLDLPDADAQSFVQGMKGTWDGTPDPSIKGTVYSNLGSLPAWVVKREAITAVDLASVQTG